MELLEQEKRKPRRAPRGRRPLAFAALALLALCAALLLRFCTPRETAPAPVEEEETPVIHYHGHALPILENVPVNTLAAEAFSADERGWRRFGGAPVGVDVSSHQKEIDWAKVAESGVDFAMLRAGRRGYTEGGLFEDDYFRQNLEGALAAGLDVGVYFFSQAISEPEAKEEADYVLSLIEGCALTYPVAFDWEPITGDTARTDGLGSAELTACAETFCDTVRRAGYTPAIYFNVDQGYLNYRLDRLTDYAFWLAEYHDSPGFYYRVDFWQYTHQGSVPGIEGAVDMDLDLRSVG